MTSETRNPADDLTISESTDNFAAKGYTAQFAAIEGANVRCFACHTDSAAHDFQIDALARTEGASDPDDMVANVAAACPSCGAKGVLTLKYGPESSLEDQDVLAVLDDKRSSHGK